MSDRLLTKEELDKVTGDRRIESLHFVFPAIEAQDVKSHRIDEVEIRQATLKAVGEWLVKRIGDWLSSGESVLPYSKKDSLRELRKALLRGEMPE